MVCLLKCKYDYIEEYSDCLPELLELANALKETGLNLRTSANPFVL